MVICRAGKMATASPRWSPTVYNALFVIFSAFFFSTGDGQEPLCMGQFSENIIETCVAPVMSGLRWNYDLRSIEDILTTTEFWRGYCEGIAGLKSCLDGRLDYNQCNDNDRTRFVQLARYDIAYRLASSNPSNSIYPVPEKICEGYHIKHEVNEIYKRTAPGFFEQCIKGEKVQYCLKRWYPEAHKQYLRNRRGVVIKEMGRKPLRRLTQKTLEAYNCVRDETQVCDPGSQELAMLIFSQTIPHKVKNNIILSQGKPGTFHDEGGAGISVNTTTEHELNSILVPWEFWMVVQFVHQYMFTV